MGQDRGEGLGAPIRCEISALKLLSRPKGVLRGIPEGPGLGRQGQACSSVFGLPCGRGSGAPRGSLSLTPCEPGSI